MSNNFDKEIAAEDEATFKSLFKPMKFFFENNDFVSKYGKYPQFWQDLKEWEHFICIKKIYMIYTDQIDGGIENPDIKKIQDKLDEKKKKEEEGNELQQSLNIERTNSSIQSIDNTTATRTKRKKRSRWDDAPVENTTITNTTDHNNTEVKIKKENNSMIVNNENHQLSIPQESEAPQGRGKPRRRSTTKWSTVDTMLSYFVSSSSNQGDSTHAIQQILILQLQLKSVVNKLKTVEKDAAWLENKIKEDPDYPREPSPPPEYDSSGKRLNTREVRMRSKLNRERVKYVDSLMKLNPLFQPPADLTREKPKRKIYIPVKDNPNFNYIGLIIGPRGATQKEMESTYNCKISIRGKGTTVSEKQKNLPGMDDELHVLVTGDTEEMVNAASIRIKELLKPVADEDNEFKKAQLRQLAVIHGTLREGDEYCAICGEKGHRQFECPHRKKSFALADVKCAICGDKSHPTRDCPMRNKEGMETGALENEYNSFLNELTGDGKEITGNRNSGNAGSGEIMNMNKLFKEKANGEDDDIPKQVIIQADMVTGFEGLESKEDNKNDDNYNDDDNNNKGKNEEDASHVSDPTEKEKDTSNMTVNTNATVPPPTAPSVPPPPARPQAGATGATAPMAIYQQYLYDPVYIAYVNYGYDPATAMQYTQAYYYHYGGQQPNFNQSPSSS